MFARFILQTWIFHELLFLLLSTSLGLIGS